MPRSHRVHFLDQLHKPKVFSLIAILNMEREYDKNRGKKTMVW